MAAAAELRELDIVDAPALRAVVRPRSQPQAIFHLAAQASVVASVEDPGRDCDVNVQGHAQRARGGRRAAALRSSFTSTGGALYGDEAPRPTPEDRIPAPLSPYGASKWAAEAYVKHVVAVVRASRTRSAGSATSTARARARTARPAWSRSSPTTCTRGSAPDALRARQADARLHLRRRRRRRAAGRGRARPASTTSRPASRPTCATIWRELSRGRRREIEPELADLRPGELQHSCLDIAPRRARARLAPGGADRRGPAADLRGAASRNSSADGRSRRPSQDCASPASAATGQTCSSARSARARRDAVRRRAHEAPPAEGRPRGSDGRARCCARRRRPRAGARRRRRAASPAPSPRRTRGGSEYGVRCPRQRLRPVVSRLSVPRSADGRAPAADRRCGSTSRASGPCTVRVRVIDLAHARTTSCSRAARLGAHRPHADRRVAVDGARSAPGTYQVTRQRPRPPRRQPPAPRPQLGRRRR